MPIKKILSSLQKAKDTIRSLKEKREKTTAELPTRHSSGEETMKVEFSLSSVFKATLIIVLLYSLSEQLFEPLMSIFLTFLISLFFATAISPGVTFIETRVFQSLLPLAKKIHAPSVLQGILERGVPRGFAIAFILILIVAFLLLLFGNIIPIMIQQLSEIAQSLQLWAQDFLRENKNNENLSFFQSIIRDLLVKFQSADIMKLLSENIDAIQEYLVGLLEKSGGVVSAVTGFIFNIIFGVLLTFFLALEQKSMGKFFHSLFPSRYQEYITKKTSDVQTKIADWVHGQIMLFFIVGTAAYVFFTFLGIEYALTLGMLFGIAEFLPYVGPAMSFLISAPIAFNHSMTAGIALLIFYAALQFIEGNILVPLIMEKAVGLSPTATIIALLVGANVPYVHPILGMILAVPVATIISIFIHDFTEKNTKDSDAPPKKKVPETS